MKHRFLLGLLLLANLSWSQYFSGDIHYAYSVVPTSDTIDLSALEAYYDGKIAIYTITNNYYKSVTNKKDSFVYSYTYDNLSKRMYDQYADRKYVSYRDSRKSNYEYRASEVFKDSLTTVLGYESYMVKYDADYGKSTSYYSDRIRVDYTTFEGHQVGNWYNKLKEVNGSIVLKSITEYEGYLEVMEAVKIVPRTVDKSEFTVSEDQEIVAAFSALDKKIEMEEPTQEQIDCFVGKISTAITENSIQEATTIYIKMVITDSGELKHLEPASDYDIKLIQVALDILQNCDLTFIPGQIDDQNVSAEVYFPIKFK